MITSDIYDFVWRDPRVSSYVLAVAPSDALRYIANSPNTRINRTNYQRRSKQECYIINTEMTEKKSEHLHREPASLIQVDVTGETGHRAGHWIVMILHLDSEIEIFDCSGSSRDKYNENIRTFLTGYRDVRMNSEHISDSNCGFFCLLYVYYRSRDYSAAQTITILEGVVDVRKECMSLYSARCI
jgi:hypothetical protein